MGLWCPPPLPGHGYWHDGLLCCRVGFRHPVVLQVGAKMAGQLRCQHRMATQRRLHCRHRQRTCRRPSPVLTTATQQQHEADLIAGATTTKAVDGSGGGHRRRHSWPLPLPSTWMTTNWHCQRWSSSSTLRYCKHHLVAVICVHVGVNFRENGVLMSLHDGVVSWLRLPTPIYCITHPYWIYEVF